ncbi:MAG: DNA repair protein RecN [Acholeplasmataceae bacterium]|nr:DNA repair protein RecN [Acholeplasmataceae bacterium]
MLKSLHIHNFALIADTRIELEPGFNVFSGETGAGKSILIDALGIALGSRASTEYIRDGEDHYWVQAVFDISGLQSILPILLEYGIEVDEDFLFLRRKVLKSGKSVTMVNGVQVPLSLLQKLSEQLIDIHGQHENQRLLKAGEPLNLIDLYGSEDIDDLLSDYKVKYNDYISISQELERLNSQNVDREKISERLEWEINEIESAKLFSGEEEALQETAKKLTNSTKIMSAAAAAYDLLNGNENGIQGVLDSLSEARDKISSALAYDKELEVFYSAFDNAWLTLEDARQSLSNYIEKDDFDPAYLTEVQERLDLWYRLKKKYGNSFEKIQGYLSDAKEHLSELSLITDRIDNKKSQLKVLSETLKKIANELTSARTLIAAKFEKLVTQHIRDLAMPQGKFQVVLTKKAELGSSGSDDAQFYFTANLGQEARLLSKVASGGELSRIALAIKTVLLEKSGVPTMVFDEIDTGVGGVTAQKMAEKIAIIASVRQVLCITHLAQIATFADNHLYIEKIVENNKTSTSVKTLDAKERVTEIMRMAGGNNISEASRINAEQLLLMAEKIKNDLKRDL